MDIYSQPGEEGIVDPRKVLAALSNQAAVTNDTLRRQYDREMTIAVMLDIATSLRVLARESSAAMLDGGVVFEGEHVGTARTMTADDIDHDDFLVVGDVVALRSDETHGVFGEIVNFGFTEGERYAEVDTYDGGRQRVWIKHLDRLTGDAGTEADPLAEVVIEGVKDDGYTINDPEPADVAQGIAADIDEDFDGDAHTAAESAVEALKASEAARKGKKKAAKK